MLYCTFYSSLKWEKNKKTHLNDCTLKKAMWLDFEIRKQVDLGKVFDKRKRITDQTIIWL